jgi:hypothetical protein
VLRRAGLSRLKDLAPAEPVIRYQYAEPGGLLHFDIKRLGRRLCINALRFQEEQLNWISMKSTAGHSTKFSAQGLKFFD